MDSRKIRSLLLSNDSSNVSLAITLLQSLGLQKEVISSIYPFMENAPIQVLDMFFQDWETFNGIFNAVEIEDQRILAFIFSSQATGLECLKELKLAWENEDPDNFDWCFQDVIVSQMANEYAEYSYQAQTVLDAFLYFVPGIDEEVFYGNDRDALEVFLDLDSELIFPVIAADGRTLEYRIISEESDIDVFFASKANSKGNMHLYLF